MAKSEQHIFIVSWGIFPFDVLVCLGSDKCEITKYISKLGYKLSEKENENITMYGNGRTVCLRGGQTILWTRKKPKKGDPVLAHEIFHSVSFILDTVGIKTEPDNDELPAYMIQYLTEEINKKL